jgi:hypothetical protein
MAKKDKDALEGNLGTLGDDEYFQHLQETKEAGVVGLDPDGNQYEVDEGVVDLRGDE